MIPHVDGSHDDQSGVVVGDASPRRLPDVFMAGRKDGHISTVQHRKGWPLGGDHAGDPPHHQRARHHLHLPMPANTNDPTQGVSPMLPWGHVAAPVRRWHGNSDTPRGISIGDNVGIGSGVGIIGNGVGIISAHQQQEDYDNDRSWGGGGRHQHHQEAFFMSSGGIGQRRHRVEGATAINHHVEEDEPISTPPANEHGAFGGWKQSEIGGSGASSRGGPPPRVDLKLLGRRKALGKRTKKATRPISVKDTMSWPQVKSMSWPLPPLAPLPHLPSLLHQPNEGEDEDQDETENTALITNHGTSGAPGLPVKRNDGGRQRLKRTCQYPNCRRSPSFSKAGHRAVYCAQHKLDGMINVVSRKCAASGCTKGPSYGAAETKKPLFCSGHRLPGHVNVVSPRCARDGCRKGPSFGCSGTGYRATYCAKHKLAGMANVVSRSCKEEGCQSAPSFGFEGERAAFCGKHKQDGQRNVISRRCNGPDCAKVPSYGKPGDPRPTFCTHHKPPGSINLLSPRRADPGCAKGPVSKRGAGERPRLCRGHGV